MSKFYVKQLFFLLVALLLFSFSGSSQNVDLVLKVADDLYANKDYYGSIQFYKKAMSIDSNNAEVLYKYGKNLSTINNNKKASKYLKKALILDVQKKYETLSYELAETYRSSGEYRKARRYYNQALRPHRTNKNGYWFKRISQSKKSATWASKNRTNTTAIPNNLGKVVNSDFSEYGASIHNGTLYFAAMIADSVQENNRITDQDYYSRIYSKSLSDKKTAKAIEIDPKTYSKIKDKHIANPSFFKDDIYFSLCDTNFICEIWKGKLIDNKLSQIKRLNNNINQGNSNNTQAFVCTINEETSLFFTSDRAKGFGGLDIYKSKKESFGFGEAINLGNTVNTADNEITPYFDTRNNTLYFSSDWHNGYGGYDVFKSQLEEKHFKTTENIGKGINTHFNEYYFKAFDKVALLSSNRTEGNIDKSSSCCNDLFEVDFETEELIIVEVPDTVNEEILNKYLPLTLYFHNDSPNPNSRDTNTTENYINLVNEYTDLKDIYRREYLAILAKKDQEDADAEITGFFEGELGDGLDDLTSFSPLLLKELEKGNQVVLTVRGFASSLSASDYNLNLTLRRIQSLINYFTEAEDGKFKPFMENESSEGGKLSFNKLSYGEFAVKNTIDDTDLISAVYSPNAIKERKIELLAISSSASNSVVNIEKKAKLKFNSTAYNLGDVKKGETVKRSFILENYGDGELKIYNVSANINDIKIEYPSSIASKEKGNIVFELNSNTLSGEIAIDLLVVSNAQENLKSLKINLKIVD